MNSNLDIQAHKLTYECGARPGAGKDIKPKIIGWEIDEGAKPEDRTRLVHMRARCKTPKPRTWHHEQSILTPTKQKHLLLELVWRPNVFSSHAK